MTEVKNTPTDPVGQVQNETPRVPCITEKHRGYCPRCQGEPTVDALRAALLREQQEKTLRQVEQAAHKFYSGVWHDLLEWLGTDENFQNHHGFYRSAIADMKEKMESLEDLHDAQSSDKAVTHESK